MSQLKLIVPGLLGPFSSTLPEYMQQRFKQPEFEVLNKWLSRAEVSSISANNYLATMVNEIAPHYQGELCQLTAGYDDIDLSSGYFYRADPVHFKADSDHAILLGSEILSPTINEAKQLIDAFNQHFKDDGISLHASSAERWYLKCEAPLELDFFALDYALGRDVKHFMPKGKDELWWRKTVNEAQMLFFQHEVNQQREENGQLGINGLWLWDVSIGENKQAPDKQRSLNTRVFTHDMVAGALAEQSGVESYAPEKLFDKSELTDINVLVVDRLYTPVCYADLDAWFDSLADFCQSTLSSVAELLTSRVIDEVFIYPCDGREFKVSRRQLARFWKIVKAVDQFIKTEN